MSKGWDTAALKKLKALTGKGLSTAEIGKRLGMSKNAIVGKLNRLGWNQSATEEVKVPKTVRAKKPAPQPKGKVVLKSPAIKKVEKSTRKKTIATPRKTKTAPVKSANTTSKASGKNLAMHQRIIRHSLSMSGLKRDQCRWPMGDPDSENFHFCGEKVFAGKPYCYEHCKQAYQFVAPKKKQG
jgi:GcrA cell cycle regulator